MVMARKAKSKPAKESAQAILDRFLSEVEPMVPVVGILGGTAAVCGVIPPFTRLLDTVAQGTGGSGIKLDLERLGILVVNPYMGGPLLFFEALLGGLGGGMYINSIINYNRIIVLLVIIIKLYG